jgi:dTDP-glucose pyrophosphorylase
MWKNISDLFVSIDTTLADVLEVIDQSGISLALVTTEEGELIGTITDGDIRRALLRAMPLSSTAEFVMNRHPVTAAVGTDRTLLLSLMRSRRKKQIPLIRDRKVLDVAILDQLIEEETAPETITAPVVIMCGGLGTRLRPLTDNVPKPLLPVRGRPLLEHTIERLAAEGFQRFFLSVHYKSETFEYHRIEGERWGVELEYIREPTRLGTAGALGLIREELREPFLVVNGDVLTEMRFQKLLDFHVERDFLITLGVKPHEVQIPYGVVTLEGDQVRSLAEKPLHSVLTNAGVYAMNPEITSLIPPGEYVDMDEVILRLLRSHGRVGAFPLHEYWVDIGRPSTYEEAQRGPTPRRSEPNDE